MSPQDAASLLELAPDASPDQVEARFLELRTRLEEKIGKAPTPGLKEKYRASLETITEAFETLTLAADSSSLPVLRAAPSPLIRPPSSNLPPPSSVLSPPSSVLPSPSSDHPVLRHLAALITAGFVAGLVATAIGIAWGVVLSAVKGGASDDADVLLATAVSGLIGLVAGYFAWRRFHRKSRERFAAGRGARREWIVVIGCGALASLLVGFIAFAILQSSRNIGEGGYSTALAQLQGSADLHGDLATAQKQEEATTQRIAALRTKERDLVRAGAGASGDLQDTRLMLRAEERFLKWLQDNLPAHPARLLQAKVDSMRKRMEDPATARTAALGEEALKLHDEYRASVMVLAAQIRNRTPDPVYVRNFDAWKAESARGDGEAMYWLSRTYENGYGTVEPDAALAREWLQKAADAGSGSAMIQLAFNRPAAEANALYRQAVEKGSTTAMVILGERMYAASDGVARDEAGAVELFRRAAEKGDSSGMFHLARAYDHGRGVAKDAAAAIEWWKKAARLDHFQAKEELKKRNESP